MSTPTVYVICNNNCKFESMTKEQILAAIVQAVNEGTIGDIDTGFIKTVQTINGQPLRFFVGEQSAYEALTDEEKKNLFAIITNDTTKDGLFESLETLKTTVRELVAGLGDGSFVVKSAETAKSAGSAITAGSASTASTANAANTANVANTANAIAATKNTRSLMAGENFTMDIQSGKAYFVNVFLPTYSAHTSMTIGAVESYEDNTIASSFGAVWNGAGNPFSLFLHGDNANGYTLRKMAADGTVSSFEAMAVIEWHEITLAE